MGYQLTDCGENWQRSAIQQTGLAFIVLLLVSGCGRSDSIGWKDRNPPGSLSSQSESTEQTGRMEQVSDSSVPPVSPRVEYTQLARSLESLRSEALADAEIVELSNEMNALIEAELAQSSVFHRTLIERKRTIERIIQEAEETGEGLPPSQQDTLLFHYSNIEKELAPYRSSLFRQPQYAQQLRGFQRALFAKMRELDASRIAEIDRMEELGTELFDELESIIAAPGQ